MPMFICPNQMEKVKLSCDNVLARDGWSGFDYPVAGICEQGGWWRGATDAAMGWPTPVLEGDNFQGD